MQDKGARTSDAVDPNDPAELDETARAEGAAEANETPDPAETLAKEAAEMRDRWMRAMAEMENLRRRSEREIADARAYGIAGFARDILAVADNMDRALKALDDEIRDKVDSSVRALLDGVDLTERELHKALEKHGVKRLEPQGQKFDPNLHQAMFEVPDPSVPSGTVVQVVQDGYKIGERVLRPALVGVAKGGPKQAPAASEDAQPNDDSAS